MKYRFLPILFLICCLAISNSLLGQVDATESVGCAPLQVNFTAPSGASTFFWNFRDGASSTDANPTNTFINPGTYDVTFSAEQGGPILDSITIQVYATPTLAITQDPAIGCSPAQITLTNSTDIPDGIDLLSTSWVFPDGTGGGGTSIEKNYHNPGDFTVTMSITTNNENCNATNTFTEFIKVQQGPATAFSVSPGTSACTGPFSVSFGNDTPGSDLTYEWDFGNGNQSLEEFPPNQTYENGTYTVSLTVTNEEGCSNTVTQKISVGPPEVSFIVADTVCVGTETILQNTSSAGTYAWSISGPVGVAFTNESPTYNFPVQGTYEIKLMVTAANGGCTNEMTKTIFAQEANATFTADPIFACMDLTSVSFTPNNPIEGATYAWTFGDDSTSMGSNPVHIYDADNESPYHPNGEFKFNPKLILFTAAGCVDSFESEVVLDIPLARFMPDTVSGCAPLAVEFSDSSMSNQDISSWQWIYGDGNSENFNTGDAHSYTYNEAGDYEAQLVITNNLGCQDTSYVITVLVGDRITPNFTVDKSEACIGEAILFSDNTNNSNIDEWHYYTNDDRSSHCFDMANPSITFENSTGAFDATLVVGYNGCLDSVTQTDIVTIKGPVAHIDYMMNCASPDSVMFTSISEEATTLTWNFGDGATSSDEMVTHEFAGSGDYSVSLTAENASTGCPASMDTKMIQIRNIKAAGEVKMEQCVGQPVMLNSADTEDVDSSCFRGYTWFFDHDALRPVTTNMPMVDDADPYPDTGMYVISLVAEDVNGCTDTARFPIIVHEVMVSFELDKEEICFPQTVQIQNLQATTTSEKIESYMWDFGDGVGMSEEENPGSYTYGFPPESQQITVSVQVEDDAGCPGSAQQTIDYYIPTSQIIAGDLSICAGESITFRGTPFEKDGQNLPLSYQWMFGNSQGGNGPEVTATYPEGGVYTVTLNYEEIATGCGGSAEITANVQDFPMADFTTDVDGFAQICAPTDVNFADNSTSLVPLSQSWDFGNGSSGVGSNVVTNYEPGTYIATLTVQTSNGCDDVVTKEFTFEQGPMAEIELSGTTFCAGEEVTATITNQNNVTGFTWEFEGQTFGENETTVTIPITQIPLDGFAPIKLNLSGVSEDCNTAISSNITVNGIVAGFDTNADPCGLAITFLNQTTGAFRSQWDFGDGTASVEDNVVHTYDSPGSYNVTLTVEDTNTGCVSSITQAVSVAQITDVNSGFGLQELSCLDAIFSLNPTFQANYPNLVIDYGDGENGSLLAHTYQQSGNYTVTLTALANGGCEEIMETIDINVSVGGQGALDNLNFVPNAFTPSTNNEMGPNDILRVNRLPLNEGLGQDDCRILKRVISFTIYNRWGKKVFSAENYDLPVINQNEPEPMEDTSPGWNGSDNATAISGSPFFYPAAVYVYAVEAELVSGEQVMLKGNVTLIR